VEPHFVVLDRTELHREKIEKQRTVGFRGQGDQFAALPRSDAVKDHVNIRRLAAQSRSVINDLRVDFPCGVINQSHGYV